MEVLYISFRTYGKGNRYSEKYWGYNEFRPQQQEIIETVAAGKDSLALLPTGGGKSICYQIPALMHPGICIVISPLIALMKDQVEQLNALKIPAVAVYSGLTKTGGYRIG